MSLSFHSWSQQRCDCNVRQVDPTIIDALRGLSKRLI